MADRYTLFDLTRDFQRLTETQKEIVGDLVKMMKAQNVRERGEKDAETD